MSEEEYKASTLVRQHHWAAPQQKPHIRHTQNS